MFASGSLRLSGLAIVSFEQQRRFQAMSLIVSLRAFGDAVSDGRLKIPLGQTVDFPAEDYVSASVFERSGGNLYSL